MSEQPEKKEELIKVKFRRPFRYRWKIGELNSRFYEESKKKKLMATKCHKCNNLQFTPMIVCAKCKVRISDELHEVSDKGVISIYNKISIPLMNGWTGEPHTDPHPIACIKLDSGVYLEHCLEETDIEKIKKGMRVEAVWKPKEERGLGTSDIKYFRIIEE